MIDDAALGILAPADARVDDLNVWRARLGCFAPWLQVPASGRVCGAFAAAEAAHGIRGTGADPPLRVAEEPRSRSRRPISPVWARSASTRCAAFLLGGSAACQGSRMRSRPRSIAPAGRTAGWSACPPRRLPVTTPPFSRLQAIEPAVALVGEQVYVALRADLDVADPPDRTLEKSLLPDDPLAVQLEAHERLAA